MSHMRAQTKISPDCWLHGSDRLCTAPKYALPIRSCIAARESAFDKFRLHQLDTIWKAST